MGIPSRGSIPSPVARLLIWAFVAVIALGVGSQLLGGSDDEARLPPPTTTPPTTLAPVMTTPPPYWMDKYEWGLKDHIDALAVDADCTELHDRYVKATLANSAVAERYGTGTADLLEYIFLVSEAIGCYDG
jgi:hypothetical protein|tara:strand:+ start:868 stop:1260 length:393 start_codon:yes stop_codon:yes gene_type:complete